MLLYDDEGERSAAEIDCLSRALNAGQYCVNATVDAGDKDFLASLASKIAGYDGHIREGDLSSSTFSRFIIRLLIVI